MRRALSPNQPWPRNALAALGFATALLGPDGAGAGPCAPAPAEILSVTYATQSVSALQDDFEENALSRLWSLKHIEPGSYAYTDKIAREGRQALLLTGLPGLGQRNRIRRGLSGRRDHRAPQQNGRLPLPSVRHGGKGAGTLWVRVRSPTPT